MRNYRPPLRYLLAFAALLAVAPLSAADDPLDALPSETGVLLRLASPADLSAKAKAFLNNAAPQFAQAADQVGPGLGSLIGNPTLAGLDAVRPWYVAVVPKTDAPPAVVIAAPAADAAALRQAVGPGYTFADYEDWTVYSVDADAVKQAQARIAGTGSSFRGSIGGSVAEVFGAGDVAVFLNVPVLREAYRKQIDDAKAQIGRITEMQGDADPATKAGMELNRRIVESALATIDEMTGVALRVTIGGQAISQETVVAVAPGSRAAGFLAEQEPSDFPLLADLPLGRPVYYAMAGDLSDLVVASTQLTAGIYQEDENLKKQMARLSEFSIHEIAGLFEFGDLETGIFRGISVAKIDSPEAYLDVARELITSMAHVETQGLQQDVTLKKEAETIEGVKVDVVTIVTTPDPNSDPTGNMQRFLEVFFGKDGLTQRMGLADGLFVQAHGGPEVMKAAIQSVKGRPAATEPAAKSAEASRGALGGKANVLLLVDLADLLGDGARLALKSNQIPIPIDPKVLDDLRTTPSYAGTTFTAGENEVRIRGYLPAEQVRGIVDLAFRVQQATQNRGGAR